jgi:hypothetical protein
MPRLHRTGWLGTLGLIVVGLALLNAGCAPVLIGGLVAAGGAAAGYAYYNGEFKRDYEAGAADVRLATRAALNDQGMVVLEEHSDPNGGWLVSRTPGGERISVTFNDYPEASAPTGFMTRVGVRVSAFGESEFSRRLLDDVGNRLGLASPSPVPPPTAAPGTIPTARLVPQPQGQAQRPGESSPPPLADARAQDSPPAAQDAAWRKPQK